MQVYVIQPGVPGSIYYETRWEETGEAMANYLKARFGRSGIKIGIGEPPEPADEVKDEWQFLLLIFRIEAVKYAEFRRAKVVLNYVRTHLDEPADVIAEEFDFDVEWIKEIQRLHKEART